MNCKNCKHFKPYTGVNSNNLGHCVDKNYPVSGESEQPCNSKDVIPWEMFFLGVVAAYFIYKIVIGVIS